ncbi:hypothetical protein SAMN05443144_111108 [Fodinibius roseus]|uniref:Uncharacterized protein n=1 Tax=Fodinibius roseus TaxID=1194090 RepID=A0A1M5DGI3_9BACT|nr:hypothetical protein [Fodinibius roseus]SHF66036.1 hypothetical protein SAMN05443144_111108 [Fodinibius roseus]
MNFSIISSFIIGTILLVSLVKVNLSLVGNSMDAMYDQVAKIHVNSIATLVSHDFRKMGYGLTGGSLQEATPSRITFQGDLDDDGLVDMVSWEWDKTQHVTETSNPNDYVLLRIVNGKSTPIKMGVIRFELSYYDKLNQPTAIIEEVRGIRVRLLSESADPVGSKYMKASWEKKFVPLNIEN